MNSNEDGNQGNNNYNFGFGDDEDDNQNDQVNNNFYQEENGNNNLNQFNNINYNNMNNNNNFINNQNNNYNQFQNNQSQFNNNYNFNNQNNQYGFNQNNYNMNNNNYNNNMNNLNQNQPNQFQNFPNNQNINYQNNNYQNVPFQQQNVNKNMQEQKPKNPDKEKLKNAYNLFMQGIMDCKKYNYEIGLDKFERVKATIEEVYPKIEKDENMKKTTDDFLKQVNKNIDITEKRIKQKYNYVPSYNYAGTDAKKEVARFLKETELAAQERKKKLTSIITNIKKKPKDSPSYYMNENNNYNNNVNANNNNVNNNQKKDDQKIITNDLRDKVLSEIVERKPDVKFTDVIGLKEAKEILREIIIVPNLRPDLFKGLRSPPRGLLLFGPPGTGKTMIAKAVATECKCTFFNISASSLTSKYLGESEKLVRTLFDLAHEMQPSVVFVDEIESILSKRKEDENDAMKRLKTEFLIQFDGVGSGDDLRVLIIGATNRPFDLDPAIIRRLPKRVYVGPFNVEERQGFIKTIITQNKCDIKDEEYKKIAEMCNNYSNSDLKELCREAAYEPLRELNVKSLKKVGELRPIVFDDFVKALRKVKGTLTKKILMELENWNKEFGALS